ncbi:MAG: hypothetical protein ACTSSQ_08900 [Alphaproteobacteria bacterium]
MIVHGHGPGSWRPDVLDIRHNEKSPDLVEHRCRHKGRPFSIVFRILESVTGKSLVTRCEKIADIRLPLGGLAFAACKLTDTPGGTRVSVREEGYFASRHAFWMFALAQRGAWRRLKRLAEANNRKSNASVRSHAPANGQSAGSGQLVPSWHMIAGSALAAALITALIGWEYGVLLFALLAVMEYGHAFVLRLAGERPSIAALLPFVGGAMAMHRRRTTVAGEALRALSGPATLAGLVVILAGIGFLAGESVFADNIRMAALVASGIVALFLLPFYPLNGGWLFGALKSSLPHEVFIVPAVVASSIVLAWSVATGAVLAALLSAALVYEMVSPSKYRIETDGSLSARRALAMTLAYGGLNLIAHTTIAYYVAA